MEHPAQPAPDAHALTRLVEVVQRLSLARDLQSVMDVVRHAARELTGADGASFVLRDGDKCFYAEEDAIAPLWKGQRFPMSACISGWVMHNRRSVAIEDIYLDPRIPADAYRPTFVRSLAMVPIRTLEPLGAIGNYWAAPHTPTPQQIEILQALADTTAVALENVRLWAELEQRVQQRTAALRAILDNVQVGVAFTRDGRIERANPRLAEILGYADAAAMLEAPLQALLQGAAAARTEALRAEAAATLARGELFSVEAQLSRLDGGAFWAHVAIKPLDGADSGAIWVIEDISDAKAKEKALDDLRLTAEASTRFKSEFLASMSHELRTPLNAIIGFSEVLRDGIAGELDARQQEYVNDIFDSGQHLLALINDVLDLSKIEAGKMTLDAEPTDLAQLLANSLSIIKEKALARRIRLRSEVPADLGSAWLDPRKCKQIIYNLLSNAVKFTPEGGEVAISGAVLERAEAARHAAAQDRTHPPFDAVKARRVLEICVHDTGIGISAPDMDRLFQPFVQIDSSLSRQFQGTGLGLALVRKLAVLHGGAVGLRSRSGAGSSFSVWLPCDAPAAAAPSEAVRPAPSAPDGEPPLVLVVEDDDRAADLIRVQLERDGCRVARAASAEAALEMLQELQPDLITLDVLLPGIDGWELLVRLKRDHALAPIPVVMLSIVADSGRGLSLGAVEVLQKPVLSRDIHQVLEQLGLLAAAAAGRRFDVLVADDDPQALELVTTQIEQFNCRALAAHGGVEAVEMARRHRPDLIVLDLMMPDLNGFEVVEQLQRDAATALIPIIVLTAKQLAGAERAQLDGQVMHVLQKSRFNSGRFIGEVRRALHTRPGTQPWPRS
jgi:PAS domain S-box-containing protein